MKMKLICQIVTAALLFVAAYSNHQGIFENESTLKCAPGEAVKSINTEKKSFKCAPVEPEKCVKKCWSSVATCSTSPAHDINQGIQLYLAGISRPSQNRSLTLLCCLSSSVQFESCRWEAIESAIQLEKNEFSTDFAPKDGKLSVRICEMESILKDEEECKPDEMSDPDVGRALATIGAAVGVPVGVGVGVGVGLGALIQPPCVNTCGVVNLADYDYTQDMCDDLCAQSPAEFEAEGLGLEEDFCNTDPYTEYCAAFCGGC